MNEGYPIVSHFVLKEAQRQGLWGLGGQRRLDSEVPTLKPHEVLVYRVGGHFIVDDRRRSLDNNQVVNATSVSVVNMQHGADVAVNFEIISKDEAKFAVQVNFVCSVVDPITVVKDGQTNASEALLAYLKGYQPLFEIGLKHLLKEIHTVRREAGLHVKAYMTMNPPVIPGMSIALANVQVMTPQELAQHEERRRKEDLDRQLEVERLEGRHAVEQRKREAEHVMRQLEKREAQALKEQELADQRALQEQQQETDLSLAQQKREGDHLLSRRQHEYELVEKREAQVLKGQELAGQRALQQQQQETELGLAQRKQEVDHLLGRRQHAYELEQAMDIIDALRGDPRQALLLAHIRGDVSADDYARRLRAMDEEDQQRSREAKEAKRLTREKAKEIARAEAREQATLDREYARDAEAIARADKIRKLEWEREDRREETAFRRAKEERDAREALGQRQQEIEVELEVLREFNKRGLLDNYYPDINEIMRRIRGEPSIGDSPNAQVQQAEDRPELTPGETDHTVEESREEYLKEEDGD